MACSPPLIITITDLASGMSRVRVLSLLVGAGLGQAPPEGRWIGARSYSHLISPLSGFFSPASVHHGVGDDELLVLIVQDTLLRLAIGTCHRNGNVSAVKDVLAVLVVTHERSAQL
jgi:hypothetical protein